MSVTTAENMFMAEPPASWKDTRALAEELNAKYGHLQGVPLLKVMINEVFAERICLSSSFGTEAAVLLALVAEVNPDTPVLFTDTRRLFGETLRYRDQLTAQLGLTDVRTHAPDAEELKAKDPDIMLWQTDPDACCAIRKVAPFQHALKGFDAWITGRKRIHGGERGALPVIEAAGDRIKINPLAGYAKEDLEAIFEGRNLPRHPLQADGYPSVGCMPCTDRVAPGGDVRAGRWAGKDKSECGIHYVI